MGLRLVVPPTGELISLQEVRDHIKCETDEDDYLKRITKAAISHTEILTKQRFLPQTWEQSYHGFPSSFQLELGPFPAIEAISYYNSGGDLVEIDEDDYRSDLVGIPARVYTKTSGVSWPTPQTGRLNSVKITYTVGYTPNADEDDPTAFPEDLKQAVLLLISHLYSNREPVVVGAGIVCAKVPVTYDYLTTPYREFIF